jgi:hypothetical protein
MIDSGRRSDLSRTTCSRLGIIVFVTTFFGAESCPSFGRVTMNNPG